MRGTVNVMIQCPFFIACGSESIICEGLIKGTRDKHIFNNERERRGYEKLVCSQNCGRTCLHYKRINELYEKGLR